MIQCSKCGTQNADKALFCSQCGTRLSLSVPPTPKTPPASASVSGSGAKKSNVKLILLCVIPVVLLLFLGIVIGGVVYYLNSDNSRGVPEEMDASAGSYSRAREDLVYADSYDGFLNIRATPSSKGDIIGRFRNGPHGAIRLSETGNWVEIDCNGIIGYVSKSYVKDYPTKAVTVDVDEKWLMGPWYPSHREYAYLLFNNGTYTVQYAYGTIAYGNYHLEGDEIIFTATMLSSRGYDIGSYERHRITVSPKRIGPLTKRSLIKEADRWEHYGELVWTWAEYAELKKQTRENVR